MSFFRHSISALLLLFSFSSEIYAGPPGSKEKLLLIGGGPRPAAALSQWVEWAGGKASKILVVTWASEVPEQVFHSIEKNLFAQQAGKVIASLTPPETSEQKAEFLKALEDSSAVFFSGGDQARIMKGLSDSRIAETLRRMYSSGIPFGGTSAGTAIMSSPMIYGDHELREGFGLLPKSVIVDQHFLLRKREGRLEAALSRQPGTATGIGIDEGGAVLIEGGKYLRVVGPEKVMIIAPQNNSLPGGPFRRMILSASEGFDLVRRRRLSVKQVCLRAVSGEFHTQTALSR